MVRISRRANKEINQLHQQIKENQTMAKLDFTKLKKPAQSILVQMESEKNQASSAQKQTKAKAKSTENKSESIIGRPRINADVMTKRFSLAFTEKELESLREKAGRVPVAVFIRDILKDAKVL